MALHVPAIDHDADPLTAALAYANAGWYVLPIKQGSKHPGSVVGFKWHTHSTRDPDQIAAHWAGTNHGLALHVGRSGAVVLDVDHPDQLPQAILDATRDTPAPMQTTRTGDTRRGHHLYTQPPGRTLGNGVGRLGGEWGEIRGLNGIIVVAPTRHAEADGHYQWHRTGPVPALPAGIAELLDDTTPATDAAADHDVAAFLIAHTRTTRPDDLDAWCRLYNKRVTAGESRHDRMVSVLTGALKEARLGHYPAADAATRLRTEFINAVTTEPTPGSNQGPARDPRAAAGEWAGILAWAVAQADAADLDDITDRHTEHRPGNDADLVELIGPTPPPAPPPSAPIVDGTAALAPTAPPAPAADPITEPDSDPPPTWAPIDLAPYLDGTYEPEQPTLMRRTDGHGLLYPGRLHSLHGESESGKSLVAQAEAAHLITAGHDVAYIDFEADAGAIAGRLLDLGATPLAVTTHLTYIRPETSPYKLAEITEWRALLARRYALIVLDGVTDALGTFGSSSKDNDEITAWYRAVARPLATRTGAAVVLIDHVAKSTENRGRFAIGGQAKMGALDGAAYAVEMVEVIGKGMRGEIALRVAKDRPGSVRSASGKWRSADRTQEAARVVVDSTDGPIVVTVEPPRDATQPNDPDTPFRPTGLMEKISRLLEFAGGSLTRRTLLTTLKSDGSKAKDQTVYAAVAALVEGGYVESPPAGPGKPQPVTHVTPYRQAQDPASDAYEAPFGDLVDNSSITGNGAGSQPLPPLPNRFPTASRSGQSEDEPLPGSRVGARPSAPPTGKRSDSASGTTPAASSSASQQGNGPHAATAPDEIRACRTCGEILGPDRTLTRGQCSGCVR